jgi:probable rRNA maturation factor
VTGDKKMRGLNRAYRGKDYPTDVLSFPALGAVELKGLMRKGLPKDGPPVVLGDVVISAPRALAQATERGHGLDDELLFLLVHGILHLAGYDHETGADAARAMRRKERELMAGLKGK